MSQTTTTTTTTTRYRYEVWETTGSHCVDRDGRSTGPELGRRVSRHRTLAGALLRAAQADPYRPRQVVYDALAGRCVEAPLATAAEILRQAHEGGRRAEIRAAERVWEAAQDLSFRAAEEADEARAAAAYEAAERAGTV